MAIWRIGCWRPRQLGARRPGARGGNVALLVALAAVPLAGMVALAVDFGTVSVIKGKLDLSADSAALLAATAASNAWRAGSTDSVAVGIAAATARFQAQAYSQGDVSIAPVSVQMTQNGGLFSATVTYTAVVPTTFARVVGVDTIPVSGTSSSSFSANPYVDVQVMMDVSSSMTIAATPADITKMESLTASFRPKGKLPGNVHQGEACAFACHWSNTAEDYYQLAIKNNVQLRVTVLQSAVSNLITTMGSLDIGSRFQLGLYTFSQNFNQVYPLSHDIGGAQASVAAIVPDLNDCSSNCPDTYFTKAMQGLSAADAGLPNTGTDVPQRFLFIITDGIYDEYLANGARAINAFNPADCAAIKAQGFGVLVLYTPYTPLPTNSFYNQYVAPHINQIQPDLEACASSPSYYFEAADATQINTQLQSMFALVVQTTSHLTN